MSETLQNKIQQNKRTINNYLLSRTFCCFSIIQLLVVFIVIALSSAEAFTEIPTFP